MKTSGTAIITSVDGNDSYVDTVNCVHCQRVHPRRATDKLGWCFRCMGPTCPTAECGDACAHFLKKIDEYEKGKRKSL